MADRYRDGHYDVQGSTSVAGGRTPGATGTQAAHGERYEQLIGHPAPVVAGERIADKRDDLTARQIISAELGHGRVGVVSAYVGSAR